MTKKIEMLIFVIGLLMVLWFTMSWCDVVTTNLHTGVQHSWNLFNIVCGICG